MGGIFGVISKSNCTSTLFYGIDYHSHLGNQRGGMMVKGANGFTRAIHDIRHEQFRAKFENDLLRMDGKIGIGCISDFDDQPLIISGKNGKFGITAVAKVNNLIELRDQAFQNDNAHFAENAGGEVSPTEIIASIISQKHGFVEGIVNVQEKIEGSCTMLLLTDEGLYAARDRWGRTPLVVGKKRGSYAVASESCALHNLGYKIDYWLGPGEAVLLNGHGRQVVVPARKEKRVCAFLWIYYGFPASSYEKINTELVRYRCGEFLAERDRGINVDAVAGVPDSGTAHALGYAVRADIPYRRAFVKYTPTWPRSFIYDSHKERKHVASMKLIPISEFIKGQRLLFCEDSIVRGTQLRNTFARLPAWGAKEVHVRSACPPILHNCKYLRFTPSRSSLELIARRQIEKLEGRDDVHLDEYADENSERYATMVENIRQEMGFTSLKYQTLSDMIAAIGLPEEQLCTYCWTGRE
ncbi:MAG: amidophosphoribosyltransferase [Oligosphaeraceae bacterium]|nr:amidophosphoribosyltransferase [Oligosphaeraceae bacterium]